MHAAGRQSFGSFSQVAEALSEAPPVFTANPPDAGRPRKNADGQPGSSRILAQVQVRPPMPWLKWDFPATPSSPIARW